MTQLTESSEFVCMGGWGGCGGDGDGQDVGKGATGAII